MTEKPTQAMIDPRGDAPCIIAARVETLLYIARRDQASGKGIDIELSEMARKASN